ncbi:DUF104 domain-containing protein [bacterium]|nr:DUF104 domain-containing protein [bacterium]
MKTIRAVWENGVFRPEEPVLLAEHARVVVTPDMASPHDGPVGVPVGTVEHLFGQLRSWPGDPVQGQRRQRDGDW